jgi:hypothetical protein
MVTPLADAPRALAIVWLALTCCVIGVTQIEAQDEAPPAVSESSQEQTTSSGETEPKPGEAPTTTDGEKTVEVTSDETKPTSEWSSSKESDNDPDDKKSRKKRLARAKASAALAGLIILGFAMVGLTWLGARVTRRYMFGPSGQPQATKATTVREDDWASKPLAKQKREEGDQSSPT